MSVKRRALTGLLLASVLALTGCVAGTPEATPGSHVTIALVGTLPSLNGDTAAGSAGLGPQLARLTGAGFAHRDSSGALKADGDFGSVRKVSDDPFEVRYTVNDGVRWSDGAQVSAADLLLAWAAGSKALDTASPKRDDHGRISNQDALNSGVYFDSSGSGQALPLVTTTPKVGDDGRSVTLAFSHPYADYLDVFPRQLLPAHVVMQHAFPDEDYTAEEADAAFVKAVESDDADVLGPVSTFWSHGFDLGGDAPDRGLLASDGPYVIRSVSEERVELEANPHYRWGPAARIQRLTLLVEPDRKHQLAALESGEADAASAAASTAAVDRLRGLAHVRVDTGPGTGREHLDLTLDNGGPFDPAAYGGDAATARAVRRAFLRTVPRGRILERRVRPIVPKAHVLDSFTHSSFSDGYGDITAANGSKDFAKASPGRARRALADAGVATPVTVRLLYPKGDAAREAEFRAIRDSAKRAGFTVVSRASGDFSDALGSGGYDAALYAWDSSVPSSRFQEAVYGSDGGKNLNGFSDTRVDRFFARLDAEDDRDARVKDFTGIERRLFEDGYGLPLYELPVVTASDTRVVTGLRARPYGGILAGYADWRPAAAKG